MSETAWQKDAIEAFRTWIYGRSVGPGDRITWQYDIPRPEPRNPERDVILSSPTDGNMPQVWEWNSVGAFGMYQFGGRRKTWSALKSYARVNNAEIHTVDWTTIRHPNRGEKLI